jgi:hypothetical protein
VDCFVASAPRNDGKRSGSSFEARKGAHLRMTAEVLTYAFTEGRSATRANHAVIFVFAASSGWPTWLPKSSQQ